MHTFSKALVASTLLSAASAVNIVNVQGQDFVDSVTGQRFEILGIDYQPGGSAGFQESSSGAGSDPLSNPTACLRDASLMQQLGINTVRVYNIDPYIDHNQCASIFNYAGIYMILDVNSPLPNESINQDDPSSSYDSAYLNRTFAILDAFREFPNTLGFFSANELINTEANANEDAAYIRAVTRDLKQYMQARGGRQVPVGYSAADVRAILVNTANYLQCTIGGTTASDYINGGRSDFFGLNSYSWCGDATFVTSTYNQLVADFANTTIPVFFSEFGCNEITPRTFTEIPTLYGPQMTTWSGGLVYEWTQEDNNFGLVNVNSDGSLSILQDYANLQNQYNSLDLSRILSANSTANSLTPPTCGPGLISGNFTSDFTLPAQPPGVSSLISAGAPGATVGSTVSVTSTALAINVTPLSGAVTSTLSINQVSSANVPGGATGSATTTAAGGSATGSASATAKKGAAATLAPQGNAAFGVGVAAAAMYLMV